MKVAQMASRVRTNSKESRARRRSSTEVRSVENLPARGAMPIQAR